MKLKNARSNRYRSRRDFRNRWEVATTIAIFFTAGGCASSAVNTLFEQGVMAKMELRDRLRQAQVIRDSRQMPPIYFSYGQYEIREDQAATLHQYAKKLRASPAFVLLIEGHCDERGSDQFNVDLGQKRADSTRDYLVRAGVAAAQLTTVSFGSDRPIARGHKEMAWVRNRRVEFVRVEDLAL